MANQPTGAEVAREAIELPDLPVIDAHIHLWTRDDYFAADMIDDAHAGHDVRASVYVECSMAYGDDPRPGYDAVGETGFVLDQVQQVRGADHALAAGILGAADLTLGSDVQGVLEAHIAAGQGRFRGIRFRVAWDADPIAGYGEAGYSDTNVLLDPAFLEGARRLEEMGLVLDLWGFHTQLEQMADFAAKLPALPITINHVGGPLGVGSYAGRRDEIFGQWSNGIRTLAGVPNVNIKLSGLGISRLGFGFQENGQVSSDMLVDLWRPYVETCVEAFGADRSIFSSNYPVDRAAAPYPVLLNAYKKILRQLPRDQLEKIFARNARRIYSLEGGREVIVPRPAQGRSVAA